MNVELVAEVTEKGAILPDGRAIMTVEQAKAFIIERMNVLEMAVTERVSAALSRHDQLAYDLKQYQHVEKLRGENQAALNRRVEAIEKMLGIDPSKVNAEHPGSGNWKLTAQTNRKPRPRAPRQITGPVHDWQKAAAEEAKKLEHELPPRCTIPDLVRRFGASRTKIDRLIGLGRLKAIREPPHTWISRESLVAYVREYGVLRPKTRQYGTNVL